MKNKALKIAGGLFLVMAVVHTARYIMNIRIMADSFEIPIWGSAVIAAALLALAVWMFKAASNKQRSLLEVVS